MDHPAQARYEVVRPLSDEGGRRVVLARDRWSGSAVILKTAPVSAARRELRALLALPSGVAPALWEAQASARGTLTLVQEYLPGRTLGVPDPPLPAAKAPPLALAICQALSQVHRMGWIHADLKPSNVLLLEEGGYSPVRLLDFGFALRRFGRGEDEDERGGTPGFSAPEVLSGWLVDGRADLYSLGAILAEIFPRLAGDPAWSEILPRLRHEIPARRFRDAVAARDAIAEAFGIQPSVSALPGFGGGPFRGRDELLQSALERLRSGTALHLLIQGRPGTGISRFLLETVLAAAAESEPAIWTVDLARHGTMEDPTLLIRFLEERARAGEAVILGVPDPSPGLHHLDERLRASLLPVVDGPGWERLRLPPLDPDSFGEVIAGSLGSSGKAVKRMAASLWGRTEGDLMRSAEGFRHCLKRCGIEEGLIWNLDVGKLPEALEAWDAPPPERGLAPLPERLGPALAVCARIGRVMPEEEARALLSRFGQAGTLDSLLDRGFLQNEELPGGDSPGDSEVRNRTSFLTAHLWKESSARPLGEEAEIDGWLHEHHRPALDSADDLLISCARARRVGDRRKESEWLAAGLVAAEAALRRSDVLRLLAYPGDPPETWTEESLRRRAAELCELLPPDWSEERTLLFAARAVRPTDHKLGTSLLEESARSPDPAVAAEALVVLADHAAGRPGHPDFPRYIGALRALEGKSPAAAPGRVEYYEAKQAFCSDDLARAETLCRRAASLLKGSGLVSEPNNLLVLAILEYKREAEAGIRTLQGALETVREPGLLSMLGSNLTFMLNLQGRPAESDRVAREVIRKVKGRVVVGRMTDLRAQRAWAWADLDRAEEAMGEARALMDLSAVNQNPERLAAMRLLLANCQLHRGFHQAALRELAEIWDEDRASYSSETRWNVLRLLVEAVHDSGRWDVLRLLSNPIRMDEEPEDPEFRIIAAQAAALSAQASDDLREALSLLEAQREVIPRVTRPDVRAGVLHHLGSLHFSHGSNGGPPAGIGRAAELFREEISLLVPPGSGYYRSRAHLALARALNRMGSDDEASAALSTALTLAKDTQSLRLLGECLQARAAFLVGQKKSRGPEPPGHAS